MAWASGQSVTSGSIATNLGYLFVFGATDSGKNLVTSTSYTTTFNTVTTGSDSIGTYVENTTGGYLQVATDVIGSAFPDADYSWFITFSREGSPGSFAATFQWNDTGGSRLHANQGDGSTATQRFYSNSGYSTASLNLGTITASTEFTVVYVRTGTTAKVFYTSGGSSLSLTSVAFAPSNNIGNLQISGWQSGEYYPGRFRAYGRWSRALSDAEAQSMANTPQQILASPTTVYEFASFNRGVGRGIARGIA